MVTLLSCLYFWFVSGGGSVRVRGAGKQKRLNGLLGSPEKVTFFSPDIKYLKILVLQSIYNKITVYIQCNQLNSLYKLQ